MNENPEVPVPDWDCLQCEKAFDRGDRGVVMPFLGDPEGRGEAAYHLACLRENLGIDRM